MTVSASKEDNQAYAKLGGALDNISDGYTYAAKFLSVVDDADAPNSGRMARVLKGTGLAQKAYSYGRKIQEAIDEKSRDGALLKLGFKLSIDIAGKLLGTSLTTHPYYAYHKAQIEALADALNAHRNSRAAVDAYRRAVTAASSAAVAEEFKRLETKKVDTVVKRVQFGDRIAVVSDIARGAMSDDFARKKIAKYGQAQLLDAVADLEAWRANWSGLCFDALQLQIMAGNELNVAIAAMKKVQDLVATMMRGSNTNRVAGHAAINNIEWEKYDQIIGQKKPSQLLMDPVEFAKGNVAKAAAWAETFAEMCDFVRSDQVVFPSKFNLQLEKVNRVLYG